jgi:hypothetical protein
MDWFTIIVAPIFTMFGLTFVYSNRQWIVNSCLDATSENDIELDEFKLNQPSPYDDIR